MQRPLLEDYCHLTLDKITKRFNLTETCGVGGAALYEVRPGANREVPPGTYSRIRVFLGERDAVISKVVFLMLSVEQYNMEKYLIIAFTESGSPVPHFYFTLTLTDSQLTYVVDLVPRVELSLNPNYMKVIFSELSETWSQSHSLTGKDPLWSMDGSQKALLSPWCVSGRIPFNSFQPLRKYVDDFVAQWSKLCTAAESSAGLNLDLREKTEFIIRRDTIIRSTLFNPDVCEEWTCLERCLGMVHADLVKTLLVNPNVTSLPRYM